MAPPWATFTLALTAVQANASAPRGGGLSNLSYHRDGHHYAGGGGLSNLSYHRDGHHYAGGGGKHEFGSFDSVDAQHVHHGDGPHHGKGPLVRAFQWAHRHEAQLAPGEGLFTPTGLSKGVRRAVRRIGRSIGVTANTHRKGRHQTSFATGNVELLLATGNVGGGGPQPEFQGGAWENHYKDFEMLLGAMVLATAKGCPGSSGWQPVVKYERYSRAVEACSEEYTVGQAVGQQIRFQGKTYTLPQLPTEILKRLPHFVKKEPAQGKKMLASTMSAIFKSELSNGKGFSGAESCLKTRMAFPYFEKGFMQLVEWWQQGIKENDKAHVRFMSNYLKNLEGAPPLEEGQPGKDLNFRQDKQLEASIDVKSCKAKEKGARAKMFNKGFMTDGTPANPAKNIEAVLPEELDWLSLALWDIYIVKAFAEWKTNTAGKQFRTLESMKEDEQQTTVRKVAKHFAEKAHIFFLQEAAAACGMEESTIDGGKEVQQVKGSKLHCSGKKDAALFLQESAEAVHDAESQEALSKYQKFLTAVPGEPGDPEAKAFIPAKKRKDKVAGKDKGTLKKMNDASADTVHFVVATLKGLGKVLLMSSHPDSDGVHCALHLYLAQKVFVAMKEEVDVKLLIVGMDVNLQTDEDFKDKGKKGEQGFNEKEFFGTTVDGTFTETPENPVTTLGFSVVWPEHPTVHKQRTFLQAQLHKAGKHDHVRKDMVFIYPKESIVKAPPAAHVWNVLKGGKEEFNDKDRYPKTEWPMDHCVTTASVTLKVPETAQGKEQDKEDQKSDDEKKDGTE